MALWTLACNLTAATDGSLYRLLAIFATLAALLIGIWIVLWRRRPHALPSQTSRLPALNPSTGSKGPPAAAVSIIEMGLLTVVVAAGAIAYGRSGSLTPLWWCGAISLVYGLIRAARLASSDCESPSAHSGCGSMGALWIAAGLCAATALIAHRWSLDDAYYVNASVAVVDHPDLPVARDGLHGVAGLGPYLPIYRLHSCEILAGAIAWLTGISALAVHHWLFAAGFAALAPFAYACLLSRLAPSVMVWAVAAAMLALLGSAHAEHWYGNLAFVKMWQGKSVLVTCLLPMIFAWGMDYGARPTNRNWLRLAAAQVAALGCTSSALWSAPVAAMLAVLAATRWDRRAIRTLLLAAVASAYLIAAGLTIRHDLSSTLGSGETVVRIGDRLAWAAQRVLGRGAFPILVLSLIPLLWRLIMPGLARRFAVVTTAAFWLMLFNPYCEGFISRNVTGPVFWRAFWALPLPALLALAAVSPLQFGAQRSSHRISRALTLVMLAALAVHSFTSGALSRRNRTELHRPELKVLQPHFDVAKMIRNHTQAGSRLLAPQLVSAWIGTLEGHPHPLVARAIYLGELRRKHGPDEIELRLRMTDAVSAWTDMEPRYRQSAEKRRTEGGFDAASFQRGLTMLKVDSVCLNAIAVDASNVSELLAANGFRPRERMEPYVLWQQGADAVADAVMTDK